MNNYFRPNLIKFISKEDIIEEVEDGYSGCLLYKVTKGNEKFFVKVFHEKLDKKSFSKIQKILEIYEKLKIKSLKIIDYGSIPNLGKYYIVYNYIEGCNLRVFTNSENCSLAEVKKMGESIGKELRKLKDYEGYDKAIFQPKDIEAFTQKAITNFDQVLENEDSKKLVTKYFKLEEIEKLKSKVNEFSQLFKKIKPKLIHGDIKRANIMLDKNQNLHIVDIESMQVNYDVLNFRYQMTWALFDEKETEFLKGYFDAIYDGRRPEYFNQQIIYMIIANFFNVCYAPEDVEFEEYLINCRNVLEKIAKMDLELETIV